ELLVRISLRPGRPVREAVAPAVEGQNPEVASKIRDLRLPEVGVDDRPGGQEKDRTVTRAEDLVMELDPVALDEALLVRIAGSHFRLRLDLDVSQRPISCPSFSAVFQSAPSSSGTPSRCCISMPSQ